MSVRIWTAQLGKVTKALPKAAVLDVTVRSGDKVFAPTWEMVRAYKAGSTEEFEYSFTYRLRMLQSQQRTPERWAEVLAMPEVVLACYCKPGAFCHRLLLAGMLAELGGTHVGEITSVVEVGVRTALGGKSYEQSIWTSLGGTYVGEVTSVAEWEAQRGDNR